MPVSVVSATPLLASQMTRLKEKLDTLTGKNVQLCCHVDPSCMGGVRLDYDGNCIDGTVANRLAAVAERLKNASW